MLSPASTNPEVTKSGDYVFRICFTDDFQGPINARFAGQKGWKRVALLTDVAQDYSMGLSSSFKDRFSKAGGQVADEESYKDDTKDFQSILTRIKEARPDAVFLPGYYDAVQLVLPQARAIGLNVPFFGGDGWDSPQILKIGAAADGCFFSTHYSADDPRPATQEFVKAYRDRFGSTPDAMAVTGVRRGEGDGRRHPPRRQRRALRHPRRPGRDEELPRRQRRHHHRRPAQRPQTDRHRPDP